LVKWKQDKGNIKMVNKNVAKLMTKEMDRKDFLKYTGGVVLAVIGVTGLMNTLMKLGGGDNHQSGGYGGSAYGK
jgi:hypothetical protein